WVFPIELRITGSPNDVVTGRTAVIPPIELLPTGIFQLQLAVRLHNRYDQVEVRRELLRLLLYEMMLRPYASNPDAFSGHALQAPPWLLRGLDELMKHRASGRPSDLYAGIVNSREILSVSKILGQPDQTLDPVSDAVFSASSAALLAALLEQESGPACFKGFLGSLAQSSGTPDPGTLLREHFPGLRGSQGALEKWWSLEIASMGQLQANEFFTPKQTEEELDQALAINLPPEQEKPAEGLRKLLPKGSLHPGFNGRVHDFDEFLGHAQGKEAIEQSRLKLKALILRAFPLHRSLLTRYDLVLGKIALGKTRGAAADLKKLDEERARIRQSMERVADYMNYYEATQAEGRNEAYEQYRQIKDQLEKQGRPVRKDRISKYLDALEAEFSAP
ncbi:MAG: hypothetical protein KDM64_16870, partial [Verrucomicrobiae bacterium]|nr:hypothetical protein [Verrucomicrobiae bacterium]